jgi:hypothetical protein
MSRAALILETGQVTERLRVREISWRLRAERCGSAAATRW